MELYDQNDNLLIGVGVGPMRPIGPMAERSRFELGRFIARLVRRLLEAAVAIFVVGVVVQLAIWAVQGVQG